VLNYLAQQGIPASQLVPNGYGKTDFVASNDTEEGRAQNRRVELVPVQ
jgi:OOP family OmpA-OmpF porin